MIPQYMYDTAINCLVYYECDDTIPLVYLNTNFVSRKKTLNHTTHLINGRNKS